jgi:hypothetical protein
MIPGSIQVSGAMPRMTSRKEDIPASFFPDLAILDL